MKDYILSCEMPADLTRDHFEKRNIPYVCFHFTMDGVEYMDDLGQSMPFDEFYARIAAGSMPTTSLVNTEQFIAFFEPFLKEGKDILHVSLSSGISGVSNSATLAAKELSEKYPERKILIVDSLGASSGYGLIMDKLADLRDEGKSIDEVYDWAMANRLRLHHWFFSTDLTYFRRSGRMSGGKLNISRVLSASRKRVGTL